MGKMINAYDGQTSASMTALEGMGMGFQTLPKRMEEEQKS